MKRLFIAALLTLAALTSNAKDYTLSTPNTSVILSAKEGEPLYFRYYGSKATAADLRAAGRMVKYDAYPAFGTRCDAPFAALVKQNNGDNSSKFVVERVEQTTADHLTTLSFYLKDVAHENLVVKVNYAAYDDCDVVKINTEYFNNGKKPIVLQKYMSAVLPIQSDNCVLMQLEGNTKNENNEVVMPLPVGQYNISTTTASRIAQYFNASFMLGLDGRLEEQSAPVIAGTLIWMGNSHFEFYNTPVARVQTLFMGGINPAASDYTLAGGKSLTTPEMVRQYGKGEFKPGIFYTVKGKLVEGNAVDFSNCLTMSGSGRLCLMFTP
jgi:alpha-galactosidase